MPFFSSRKAGVPSRLRVNCALLRLRTASAAAFRYRSVALPARPDLDGCESLLKARYTSRLKKTRTVWIFLMLLAPAEDLALDRRYLGLIRPSSVIRQWCLPAHRGWM